MYEMEKKQYSPLVLKNNHIRVEITAQSLHGEDIQSFLHHLFETGAFDDDDHLFIFQAGDELIVIDEDKPFLCELEEEILAAQRHNLGDSTTD